MPKKKEEQIEAPVEKPKESAPKLVKMKRDGRTANVHPYEVDNFASHGWIKE